jgi:hypothetical protein
MNLPSDSELAVLAVQVDEQLNALQAAPTSTFALRGAAPGETDTLPAAPEQQAVIEQATGEKFETFWQKYRRQARRDLCLPGGLLYEQWHKWRDLESKSAVRCSYVWLAAFGIPTGSLAPAAVAATVFLLNVVVKVGIEAVCEGCAEEEKARDEAKKHATDPKAAPG